MTEREYKEKVRYELHADEESFCRHTYQEEHRILDAVRLGNVEEAVRLVNEMDFHVTRLAVNEVVHWRNMLTVGVTLCTRAAIEGGVKPYVAYRISDFYIIKGSECREPGQILSCRNRAVEELTQSVYEVRKKEHTSIYVERCRDYVEQHYREKIYLDYIAESLGISGSYLSRLFKKETGMCLQDYINDIRVRRAAHLLVYSEEPIPEIAAYVNFPSQSYFGKLLKKKTGKTPKQYREEYKTPEFISQTHSRLLPHR